MLKKIILICVLTILTSCGFVPINNLDNNKKVTIESIEIIDGDRKLNIALERNLKRYQQKTTGKSFKIKINTNYEKKTISKNTTGASSKYQLKASANFKILYNNSIENISFEETFNIDHSNDDFENRNYENTVKENFANSISQKLIFKLLSLL